MGEFIYGMWFAIELDVVGYGMEFFGYAMGYVW